MADNSLTGFASAFDDMLERNRRRLESLEEKTPRSAHPRKSAVPPGEPSPLKAGVPERVFPEAAPAQVNGVKPEAASTAVSVIRTQVTRVDEPATPAGLTAALIHADAVLERTSVCGESTGLVVAICDGIVFGASVGDSEAVLADAGGMTDLTAHQRRKPLLGSGSAMPVSFDPVSFRGVLVAGTDGLFKYCVPKAMLDILSHTDGDPVVGRLVSAVRLPSGALRDDVGIVVMSA